VLIVDTFDRVYDEFGWGFVLPNGEYRTTLKMICDSRILKSLCPGWWKAIGGHILSDFEAKHREVMADERIMAERYARRLRYERELARMTDEQRTENSRKRRERGIRQRAREKAEREAQT
jgi:hypothetical protein